MYVNIGYPWRGHYTNNPPMPPIEENHVGSYRNSFTIPAEWKGKNIMIHFGSVTSNIYLWINGKFVGYSEDSKLAAEFDVFITLSGSAILILSPNCANQPKNVGAT